MVTKMFDIKIEILISNGKELQWSFESVWLGFGKPLRLKATGFSKLQLNLKKLSTSFFSVSFYVALWRLIEPCVTTINTDSYVSIFSRQTRPSSLKPVRQTTATDNQIRTQIRPLHPNTQQTIIRSDHQIRPSDHTTTATLDQKEGILYAHASIWAVEVPQSDHRGIFYELFTFSTSICRLFSGAEWRVLGATFHKHVL